MRILLAFDPEGEITSSGGELELNKDAYSDCWYLSTGAQPQIQSLELGPSPKAVSITMPHQPTSLFLASSKPQSIKPEGSEEARWKGREALWDQGQQWCLVRAIPVV